VKSPAAFRSLAAALMVAAAGSLYGLDTGLITEALKGIAQEFHLSVQWQEWVVSTMLIGAAVGSVVAGGVAQRFGRRYTLAGAMVLTVAGVALCVLAVSPVMVFAGRLLIGLEVGVGAFLAPLYISELATNRLRGSMITAYSMLQNMGTLFGYGAGGWLASGGHWRWIVGIPLVPAVVLCVAYLFLPASPAWLARRGRHHDAKHVLHRLREDVREADAELKGIEHDLERAGEGGFGLLRHNRNFRRSVGLGVMLQVFQQFSGINVLLYYAPRILQGAHFGTAIVQGTTIAIGAVNVVVGIAAVFVVNRWGRRPLLVLSAVVMALAMAVIVGIEAGHLTGTVADAGLVGALLVVIVGYGIGAGPVVWAVCSEIQPLSGREFGVSCSTFANWAVNWLVSGTALSLLTALGTGLTFAGFMVANVLFAVFTLLFVPETRGVSMETIEEHLMEGRALRRLGE